MNLSYRSIAAMTFLPMLALGSACESGSGAGSERDSGVGADSSTPIGIDSGPGTQDGASTVPDATTDALVVIDSGTKDSGKADSGPKTQGEMNAETYCSAMCAFAARCSKSVSDCSNGGAPCVMDATNLAGYWRDEYTNAFKTCYPALACASNPDTCIQDGFASADPTFPNSTYIQDCLAKRTACSNPFADDLCLSLAALTDANRTKGARTVTVVTPRVACA